MKKAKVGMIGCGYIGLIGGTCWASIGHEVVGVDNNEEVITKLKKGILPFYEANLEESFTENISNWEFSTNYSSLSDCKYIMINVATPTDISGVVDLSQLESVIKELKDTLNIFKKEPVIVFRSTMPPGTLSSLVKPMLDKIGDIKIIHFPEFLREGNAIEDFHNPPRVVIGANNPGDAKTFYNDLCSSFSSENVFITSLNNSEFAKYFDNSWHACKVAFANEVSAIASKYSVNLNDMYNIFKADNVLNISAHYLRPGAPFGGSCLRKDTDGLKGLALNASVKAPLIESINTSNYERIKEIYETVKKECDLKSKILIEGFSFKKGTSDVREAPQAVIRELLSKDGYDIHIYDPTYAEINPNDKSLVDIIRLKLEKWDCIIRFQNLSESIKATRIILDYSSIPVIKKFNEKN